MKQMSKVLFKKLYFEMTNKDMADKLEISKVTLNTYAKKLGYRKGDKYKGNRNCKSKIDII